MYSCHIILIRLPVAMHIILSPKWFTDYDYNNVATQALATSKFEGT